MRIDMLPDVERLQAAARFLPGCEAAQLLRESVSACARYRFQAKMVRAVIRPEGASIKQLIIA
jgi:hypothetical protein